MKGDGAGFNASFLWPEASLNACHCRKDFHCCSSIHVPFPVDWDLTFHENKELPPVVCLLTGIRMQPTDPGRHKKRKQFPKTGHLVIPRLWAKPFFQIMGGKCLFFHLAGGGGGGGGDYKWWQDVPHPGNVDLWSHSTSLYLTVISTLGNVHNTVGYSFPFLPPALQGGLQCGWWGDMTIPSTFTVVKFTHRQPPFLWSEPQRADEMLGILWRISGG